MPHKHELLKIAKETLLNLTDEQKLFLDDISDFNINARYPDYKLEFYKLCTKEFTTEKFEKIKTFYEWLLSQIKS